MPPLAGLRFHHIGLAVRDDRIATDFLAAMGYACGPVVYDPEQNVRLRMCDKSAAPSIEIVFPGDGDGPLTPILKQTSQMIYHTCYEVDDRDEIVEAIRAAGFRCIEVASPRPAVLFGGRKVSFHQVPGFGLIELLDRV